ncbi:hypothetical protein [Aerococcus urinaeequi]
MNENGDIVITIENGDEIVIPNPNNHSNGIENIQIDSDGNLISL